MSKKRVLIGCLVVPGCCLVALVAAVLAFAALFPRVNIGSDVYRIFDSPMADYHLIVYRYRNPFPLMPGHGGNVPGFVRLYDTSGRIWGSAEIGLVSTLDEPTDVKWYDSQGSLDVLLPGELGHFAVPKETAEPPARP